MQRQVGVESLAMTSCPVSDAAQKKVVTRTTHLQAVGHHNSCIIQWCILVLVQYDVAEVPCIVWIDHESPETIFDV